MEEDENSISSPGLLLVGLMETQEKNPPLGIEATRGKTVLVTQKLGQTQSCDDMNVGKLTFMDLPPEVRNTIYALLFNKVTSIGIFHRRARHELRDDFRVFCRTPKAMVIVGYPRRICGYYARALAPPEKRHMCIPPQSHVRWEKSVTGLHLTCKAISIEVMASMYASFDLRPYHSGIIAKVLANVPAYNLSFLKRLETTHRSYGTPSDPQYMKWKIRADDDWNKLLQRMVTAMPNLTTLKLIVHVHDKPFRLRFSEKWVQPLLHLRQLTKLEKIHLGIRSRARIEHDHMSDAHNTFEEALVRIIRGANEVEAMEKFVALVERSRRWCNSLGADMTQRMDWLIG